MQTSPEVPYPTRIYLFKVNNGNTRTRCEICSKLKINQRHQNDVNDVALMSLLLTLLSTEFASYSGISVANVEQVNTSWVYVYFRRDIVRHGAKAICSTNLQKALYAKSLWSGPFFTWTKNKSCEFYFNFL